MQPRNIVKFIANHENEACLSNNIENFAQNLKKAFQKKFQKFYDDEFDDSCVVVDFDGKIFTYRLLYNNTECKYVWSVELEKDD
jgi:CRISPR/Cas system endoribonuclease Cas6 (RAMP superfamily)